MQYGYLTIKPVNMSYTRHRYPGTWLTTWLAGSTAPHLANNAGGYSFVKSGPTGGSCATCSNQFEPARTVHLPCGTNSSGDVVVRLLAAGGPGPGYLPRQYQCRTALGYTKMLAHLRHHSEAVYYVPLDAP